MNTRILTIIAIVLVGIPICVKQLGMQFMTTWLARKNYSHTDTPEMYLIPTALPELISSPALSSFTNSACSFSTPWGDPVEIKVSSTNVVAYSFTNDIKAVVWLDGFSVYGVNHFRKMANKEEGKEKFECLFEASNLQSNYNFLNACLSSTPDHVSFFTAKTIAMQKSAFLMLKSVMILPGVHACYVYDFDGQRGFQFGDTAKDKRVKLICFTSPDTAVEIDILTSKSTNPVSQQEINCILKSLKKNANQKFEPIANGPEESGSMNGYD